MTSVDRCVREGNLRREDDGAAQQADAADEVRAPSHRGRGSRS